jgi:hypothetical protein
MKHLFILLICVVLSVLVAFYDWLPLPSGGMFYLMKRVPWLFDLPVFVGMFFTPRGAHGVSPWGLFLGVFVQAVLVAYGLYFLAGWVVKRLKPGSG